MKLSSSETTAVEISLDIQLHCQIAVKTMLLCKWQPSYEQSTTKFGSMTYSIGIQLWYRSCDSLDSMVTPSWTGWPKHSSLIPDRSKKFFLLQNIQTSTDAHPNSHTLGNKPSTSWDKAAWTCKIFASFTRKNASENFKFKHIYLVTALGLHGIPGTQVFHAVWKRNSGVQCPAKETRCDGCSNQGTWRIYKRDGESCTNWSCFFGWICQQASSTAVASLTDC